MNFFHRRKYNFSLIVLAGITCLLEACSPYRKIYQVYRGMDVEEQSLVDSILAYALDHEAIYTLQDTLKPMSSVKFFQLPLLSFDKMQLDSGLNVLRKTQKAFSNINSKNWKFVFNPFERSDSIYKNIELYVIRKEQLSTVIARHMEFYAGLGLSSQSSPETILAVTEHAPKYQRWRSYGYLFGYPDHAVDFFVNAGKEQDSTGNFVNRSFFQIPVFASKTGYFTYALPKDYQPGVLDSAIHHRAEIILQEYNRVRKKYLTPSGLKAMKLICREWNRKK